MRLIGLAVVLALSFTLVSLDAEGQQAQGPKAAKIGFLLGGTPAEGHYERLPALAREFDGASYFLPEINAKRLELLKEAAPHIARVAVLYNALNAVDEVAVVAIEAVAQTLQLRIQRLAVRAPADFDAVSR
jgi:hypothetical protein